MKEEEEQEEEEEKVDDQEKKDLEQLRLELKKDLTNENQLHKFEQEVNKLDKAKANDKKRFKVLRILQKECKKERLINEKTYKKVISKIEELENVETVIHVKGWGEKANKDDKITEDAKKNLKTFLETLLTRLESFADRELTDEQKTQKKKAIRKLKQQIALLKSSDTDVWVYILIISSSVVFIAVILFFFVFKSSPKQDTISPEDSMIRSFCF